MKIIHTTEVFDAWFSNLKDKQAMSMDIKAALEIARQL
jgi:hypothetical protein